MEEVKKNEKKDPTKAKVKKLAAAAAPKKAKVAAAAAAPKKAKVAAAAAAPKKAKIKKQGGGKSLSQGWKADCGYVTKRNKFVSLFTHKEFKQVAQWFNQRSKDLKELELELRVSKK